MKVRVGALLALVAGFSPVSAATVTVTPGNLNGWTAYVTDSSRTIGSIASPGVTADFGVPLVAPPLGSGAAHLTTGTDNGNESAQFRTSAFRDIKIAELTQLSYSTLAVAWNGQQLPFITIWLDFNNDGIRDDRLWFEPAYSSPPQSPVALNTWQTWDALAGNWYSDNFFGPGINARSLTDYLNAVQSVNPSYDPTIIDAAPGVGGFRIASGFASDPNEFDAFFDNLIVGTPAGSTTFDFEVTANETIPEPASLALWSVGMAAAGFAVARKRRVANRHSSDPRRET